jgi:hypothetical protein
MQNSILLVCFLCAVPANLIADVGDPLAVRRWPGGSVSIESHWGLHLVVDPHGDSDKHLDRRADQTISPDDEVDHYLSRQPNASSASWTPTSESKEKDLNAIRVKSIRQTGEENVLLIEVDGVRIVYVPTKWFVAQSDQDSITVQLQGIENPDLLILDVDNLDYFSDSGTVFLLKFLKPKRVLLSRIDPTDESKTGSLRERFGAEQFVSQDDRNTIALTKSGTDSPMKFMVIAQAPWQMPESLAVLYQAMEKANEDSQDVFAKLSANQMNFKPANGTHTPRWNTEHMMGRQLLFFSQIYHAQNPAIPVIDLNPKQMPPDYVFAHPEWDGSEEARQMQRVSEFTRRFAYLLDGVELDKKAPGSRWTLRGLLKQMQRHYAEHTANTVKKFDLPGWPRE